jgi:hypothetical protein
LSICDNATPAMPAMPEPSPKVSASTREVAIPIEAAMRRFWVTARICKPNAVKRSIASRITNTASVKQRIHSRL